MNVLSMLKEAVEQAVVLRIKYHGGSQPGAVRDIAPIEIMGDKIRARCYASNAVKTFMVEKIEILEGDGEIDADTELWQRGKDTTKYHTLDQAYNDISSTLDPLEWHIEKSEASISLHRRFKNGNPRKGSEAQIVYEEYDYGDIFIDEEGNEHHEEPKLRIRPWVIRSKTEQTRTYKDLDNAAKHFLGWIKSS